MFNNIMWIVISHKAVWSSSNIVEGLSHRYVGLYSNIAKYVTSNGGCVFWYDVSRRRLLEICRKAISVDNNISLLKALIKSLKRTLYRGSIVIVLLDYPHSFLGVRILPHYLITLLLFHAFRLSKRVFVVVDNMDPPIEHALELHNGKIDLLRKALWILLNSIVFRYDLIVFHSNAYRAYHKLYYGVDYSKSEVIPPGSFPDEIPYTEISDNRPIRILCSGHVAKWIGLEKLRKLSREIAERGLKVKFVIIDKSAPGEIVGEDIELIRAYLDYKSFTKMLVSSHVLLLLRPKSLHHLLTVRASLADYIMSGRPVLYLHSLGIRSVVGGCECAFELKSIDELPDILLNIASNNDTLKALGRKCRLFAIKYLDYKKNALILLSKILLHYLNKYRKA